MGQVNIVPDGGSVYQINDFNQGTYYGQSSFPVAAGQFSQINWGYPGVGYYMFDEAHGYPASSRHIIQVRSAATMYQSHNECISTFAVAGLGSDAQLTGTTAYTTVYGAWVAPPAAGSHFDIAWYQDNRPSGLASSFRLIDVWVEVIYADYPSNPVAASDKSVATTTFTAQVTLPAIGTGQSQSAQFQIATDPGFGNVIWSGGTGQVGSGLVTVTSPVVGPGTYYARAYALDQYGYGSGWSGTQTITVSYPAPPTPTVVTPASGATVTIPNPVLGATLGAATNGQTQRAEWQIAPDNTFTSGVRVITEATSDLRVSGATTESPTLANLNLANGTWWVRARSIDVYGQASGYSAGTSFTVSVAPPPVPTVLTPASGATVTTTNPTLGATLGAASNGRLSKAEWRLSKDNTFAVGVYTVTEADGDRRTSGATTELVPTSVVRLTNGTWYMQARSIADDGSASAFSATQSFTVALAAPPTPTALTPAAGSTVTTNTPTVGGTVGAATDNRKSKLEFQFATDSGFTTNIKTVLEPDTALRLSGASTIAVPIAQKLSQTTWYMRARAIDEFGSYGAYTASQTIIPNHPPNSTGQAPTANITLLYAGTTPFSWVFTDPFAGDSQRAYQIVIERNDTGATVLDTGKIVSTSQAVTAAIPVGSKDVQLRWKLQVWDQDDVGSGFSNYYLFYVSDAPVVTITSPTLNQVVGSGKPTITWTNDAQTVQQSYRVVFTRVSDGAVIHDSGVVLSNALSYTPPQTILTNLVNYSVAVTIVDTVGLSTTVNRPFSTSYTAPPTVTYTADGSTYDIGGYVGIDWSQQTPDPTWLSWRLYRRALGDSQWTFLKAWTDVNVRTYKDWTALSGTTYEYAVTQTADRSGVTFESIPPVNLTDVPTISSYYWLLNPTDSTKNFLISNVSSDSYTDSVEQETYTVIGRGQRTDYGTDLGITGTITALLRDRTWATARQQKQFLENIKRDRVAYLLRTPFGDLYQVSMNDVTVSRVAGVGRSEFVDVTIPYTEVI
jgi:hypothetical protein